MLSRNLLALRRMRIRRFSVGTLFRSFKGSNVKRAAVYEFYKLGDVQSLRSVKVGGNPRVVGFELQRSVQKSALISVSEITINTLVLADIALYNFMGDKENAMLPGAVEAARELETAIVEELEKVDEKAPLISDDSLVWDKLQKFENLLDYDLKRFPTFSVEKTGIFDSEDLVIRADNHLSERALRIVSPEVREDVKAAGRCLAFELFTACGFHAVRALEATARIYHKQMTGMNAAEDGKPMGGIANDLRDIVDDVRGRPPKPRSKDDPLRLVVNNLDRMNNIYRKPLTHPEMVLKTRDDAKNVFDLAIASIALISEQLIMPMSSL